MYTNEKSTTTSIKEARTQQDQEVSVEPQASYNT